MPSYFSLLFIVMINLFFFFRKNVHYDDQQQLQILRIKRNIYFLILYFNVSILKKIYIYRLLNKGL